MVLPHQTGIVLLTNVGSSETQLDNFVPALYYYPRRTEDWAKLYRLQQWEPEYTNCNVTQNMGVVRKVAFN